MRMLLAGFSVLLIAFLGGCGSNPVVVDAPAALQPDQGVAAVVLSAPDRITKIKFAPRFKGGDSFEVPDTLGGAALYLVPVKAGRYCLENFFYNNTNFKSVKDLSCFTVVAGHITYGGEVEPELNTYSNERTVGMYTKHEYDSQFFHQLLQEKFPKMAAAYPLAGPAPLPAGIKPPSQDKELSTWVQMDPDHGHSVYVQNNASWTVVLERFQLLGCENVAESCGEQTLDLELAPFETRRIMTINPADPKQPFYYQYQYNFRGKD
ncbi:MAG: hypothetical protein ACM3ZT_01360 [Bacillota bacterium]